MEVVALMVVVVVLVVVLLERCSIAAIIAIVGFTMKIPAPFINFDLDVISRNRDLEFLLRSGSCTFGQFWALLCEDILVVFSLSLCCITS